MEECKWNYELLGYYIRFTKYNKFIILGKKEGQWRELVNINFSFCYGYVNRFKRERIDFTTDCFQGKHEWDTHKKEGWVYCWICGAEKRWETNEN